MQDVPPAPETPTRGFCWVMSLGICFFCPKHLVYMLTFTPGEKWQEENIIVFGAVLGYWHRSRALIEKHGYCQLQGAGSAGMTRSAKEKAFVAVKMERFGF